MQNFPGEVSELAATDQFVLMFNVVPGYDMRLATLLFKFTYQEETKYIDSLLEHFDKTFSFFEKKPEFKRFGDYVMHIGNYINGKSPKGGMIGFKIDTLTKIGDFKTNDGKMTLLVVIIEYLYKAKEESILEAMIEMTEECSKSLSLNSEYRSTGRRFERVL